jgi:pyruvate dehydrogenase E2 component (dihydrolipoamide acetyltransferase)
MHPAHPGGRRLGAGTRHPAVPRPGEPCRPAASNTFTVTDTGGRGTLFDTPALDPPQAGFPGMGAVVERPVVVRDADGQRAIAIRSMAYLSLACDPRRVDGADAARFPITVRDRLEAGRFAGERGGGQD